MKKFLVVMIAMFAVLDVHSQGFANVEGREKVDYSNLKKSVVLFTFGQSNSANYGQWNYLYACERSVYNYFGGELYKAKDPLLGADGTGATVWTRLGDMMVAKGFAEAVTIVPIGIGGVEIKEWAKGGRHYQHLLNTLDEMVAKGVKIDYVCWHQGESDNIANTPKQVYIDRFLTIREAFRSRGINAPIVIAKASYHPDCIGENHGCSKEIVAAQEQLAKSYADIFIGPDTDRLDKTWQRADGVHFSYLGQMEHAKMWLKAIKIVRK